MTDRLPQPRFEVLIDEGGTPRPLRDDYARLFESATVEQIHDGADMLTLDLRAWDARSADFMVVGERILSIGSSIIFRAGYGATLRTMGRFDIVDHQPTFGGDGASLQIVAHDGFARLMLDTFPADYGTVYARWDDVAARLAERYGFGIVADFAPSIPYKSRTVRTRKGKGKYAKKTVGSRVQKNGGTTDAEFVKHLAGFSRFLHPKVRYVEERSDLWRQAFEDYDRAESISGNVDVLFFHKASLRRQKRSDGRIRFRYRAGDGASTLASFTPLRSSAQQVQAVRVHGLVAGKPVTYEAELVGPAQRAERNALQREAARAASRGDEDRLAAIEERLSTIDGDISVQRVEQGSLGRQDRAQFNGRGDLMAIDVLGDERTALAYDPVRKKQVQTGRRQVIRGTVVRSSGEDLAAFAEAWLRARMGLAQTGAAFAADIPGLEAVYPGQVHDIDGVTDEYAGAHMFRRVVHAFRAGSHTVDGSVQRVPEIPARVNVLGGEQG